MSGEIREPATASEIACTEGPERTTTTGRNGPKKSRGTAPHSGSTLACAVLCHVAGFAGGAGFPRGIRPR